MTDEELKAWADQFERELRDSFTRLGRLIEQSAGAAAMRWQAAASSARATTGAPAGDGPQGDPVEALRRLKQLQTEGLISEADYEAKKKEILARL